MPSDYIIKLKNKKLINQSAKFSNDLKIICLRSINEKSNENLYYKQMTIETKQLFIFLFQKKCDLYRSYKSHKKVV